MWKNIWVGVIHETDKGDISDISSQHNMKMAAEAPIKLDVFNDTHLKNPSA